MMTNAKVQERALPWSPETDNYIVVSYNDDDIDFSDCDTWA